MDISNFNATFAAMIRDNVKTICTAKGITLAQLAQLLNVSRQSLHRYTTGRPTLDTIQRIADALKIPPFVLLHPAPLAALAQLRTGQMEPAPPPSLPGDPDQAPTAPPVFRCPICGTTFAPGQMDQDKTQPKPRKRGRPRKTSPEESKLF